MPINILKQAFLHPVYPVQNGSKGTETDLTILHSARPRGY